MDDLSCSVPGLSLPLEGEFSASRGVSPGKYSKGIGIERMAVADAHEGCHHPWLPCPCCFW